MPDSETAAIEITGYNWVPDFAKGLVRDLRVRWALEEIGLPYRVRLLHPAEPRPETFLLEQPFGQVPTYREDDVHLFESGAILLHIGEKDERLLPREAQARARVTSWVFAALNSIEPFILSYQLANVFDADKPGATDYAPATGKRLGQRLRQLSDALGTRDWLTERFSVADILMAHVLMPPTKAGFDAMPENLAAYVERARARPAFQAALAAQLGDFTGAPPARAA